MDEAILITGANGTIGTWLRQSLRRPGRHLRLLDLAEQTPVAPGEDAEVIQGSFLDEKTIALACQGVEAVIHLGGRASSGYSWAEYLEDNIDGTFAVLEAARQASVTRIVFASSNHAVGFHPLDPGVVLPDYLFPQPDTYYGLSKVAGEGLSSLFADRYGLDAVCLRIGSFLERPTNARNLWSWLSPGDCTRLFEAALSAPSPGFRVVWGVSANSRGLVSLEEGAALGYHPVDDAEAYADELLASPDADDPLFGRFVGGTYAAPDLE